MGRRRSAQGSMCIAARSSYTMVTTQINVGLNILRFIPGHKLANPTDGYVAGHHNKNTIREIFYATRPINFTKRQKEQARQQKQRDKNERKTSGKTRNGRVVLDEAEELRQMREHAQNRPHCSASG